MSEGRQKSKELARLAALKDDEIDTTDIPEVKDWSRAEIGKFYRPVKKQVTLRLDVDVLEWFKSQGGRYQSTINKTLRLHMTNESAKAAKVASVIGTVRSGDPCPESGVWSVENDSSTTVAVAKGELMPPVRKKKVVWIRKRAA